VRKAGTVQKAGTIFFHVKKHVFLVEVSFDYIIGQEKKP
jgi:hypothetical protein